MCGRCVRSFLGLTLPGGIQAVLQEVRGVHILFEVGHKLSVPSLKGDGGDTGGREDELEVACVPSSPHLSELINEGLPLPQLVIVPEGSLKQS